MAKKNPYLEGLLANDRQQEVSKIVNQSGSIRVTQLSRLFGVTEETIRRDLEKLESEGKLKRIHGGAISLDDTSRELPLDDRTTLNIDKKHAIAKKASHFIHDGDIIAVDSSTTCFELIKVIKHKHITLLTNSLLALLELRNNDNVTVFCTGGYYHNDHHAFLGHSAENAITDHSIGKLFLSCKALDPKWGISESHEQQAMMKREFLNVAEEIYLLVDSTKVNYKALVRTSKLDQIHFIITDEAISADTIQKIEEQGVEVIVASH
ncbi:DeoR/GlpR family DNA-binding transcription regulator [Salirhabdus salicampi]|uniref:DeoR/GlpR family DNA-binding transcription regulator n=1 Tax=Salirhabdus salicampi TaxID=476102 RepID=UPI0020C242DC|nr:DeoR/GlpR family DNA-binding transcription regulator [Salirhabdus salicampi]MCP8615676.1 DeoR/GlpR family DNA-binding transcription regulator [Salirhabdus salicampi]